MKGKKLLGLFVFPMVLGIVAASCGGGMGDGMMDSSQLLQDPEVVQTKEESLDELSLVSEEINYTEIEQEINSYLASEQLLTSRAPRISVRSSDGMASDGMSSDGGYMQDGGNDGMMEGGDQYQQDGSQMQDDGTMMRDDDMERPEDEGEKMYDDMEEGAGVPADDIGEGIEEVKKRAPEKLKRLLENLRAEKIAQSFVGLTFASQYCVFQGKATATTSGDCQFFRNMKKNMKDMRDGMRDGSMETSVNKTCNVDVSFSSCAVKDVTLDGSASFQFSITVDRGNVSLHTSVSVSNLMVTDKNGVSATFNTGKVEISAEREGRKGGKLYTLVDIEGEQSGKTFSIYSRNEFEKVERGPLTKSYYAKVSYQESATSEPVEVIVEKTKRINRVARQEKTFSLGITDTVRVNGTIKKGKEMDLTVQRGQGTHTTSGSIKIYKKDGRVISVMFEDVKISRECMQNPVGGRVTAEVERDTGEVIKVKTTFRETCSCEADVEIEKDGISASETTNICEIRRKAKEKEMREMMEDDRDENKKMGSDDEMGMSEEDDSGHKKGGMNDDERDMTEHDGGSDDMMSGDSGYMEEDSSGTMSGQESGMNDESGMSM